MSGITATRLTGVSERAVKNQATPMSTLRGFWTEVGVRKKGDV